MSSFECVGLTEAHLWRHSCSDLLDSCLVFEREGDTAYDNERHMKKERERPSLIIQCTTEWPPVSGPLSFFTPCCDLPLCWWILNFFKSKPSTMALTMGALVYPIWRHRLKWERCSLKKQSIQFLHTFMNYQIQIHEKNYSYWYLECNMQWLLLITDKLTDDLTW